MSYSLQVDFAGQVGVFPGLARMVSTDDLTAITTPGYISAQSARVATLQAGDFLFAKCATGSFPFTVTVSNGVITLASGAGSGDVIGPGGSSDNGLVVFDGTTGTIIKQSNLTGTVYLENGVVSVYSTTPYGQLLIDQPDAVTTQEFLGFQGSGLAYQLAGYNDTTGESEIFSLGVGLSVVDGELQISGGGTGDVSGPGPDGSTDTAIPRWSGVDGDLLNNSIVRISNSGTMSWTLADSPTTQPYFQPQVVGGKSQFIYVADQQFIQGVTSVTLSGPAVARGTIGAVGTLSRYNANHVYLGSGTTLSPTQDQSSNIFNYAALSTNLTVTLPLISTVTPGTFYDFILTNTGSSIIFTATAPDTVANVNGQTSLTNQYSSCRAIASQFGAANYWELIIVDKISAGGGDVVGPVSSTDNAIVRFDGTTGALIQDTAAVTMSNAGVMFWDVGVVTTDASLGVSNVAGDSHFVIEADSLDFSGITQANIVAPAINAEGTLYGYNDSQKELTTDYVVVLTDSASVFDWNNASSGTITLPAWIDVPPGFYGWVNNMSGTSMTLTPIGGDTIQNVNGEDSITDVGSAMRYSRTTSTGIWQVDIFGVTGAGTGDVTGPGSSVNHGVAVYNGTTGKVIQALPFSPSVETLYGDVTGSGAIQQVSIDNTLIFNGSTLGVNTGAINPVNMNQVVPMTSFTWGDSSAEAGTVSISNGSPTLTGVSTLFTEVVANGDTLILFPTSGNPVAVKVLTVNNNTSISLTANFGGATITGGTYEFSPAGTISVSNGSSSVTGISTLFLETLTPGDTVYFGDTGVAYVVSRITSNTQLLLTTNYTGTTLTNVPYFFTSSFTETISNANVLAGDKVTASMVDSENADVAEAFTSYKNIILRCPPSPVVGETIVDYTVIRPSTGTLLYNLNTVVGPTTVDLTYPGGNTVLPGTVSWPTLAGGTITGDGTQFTQDFESGDFIIMRRPGLPSFAMIISTIVSDTQLTVNASNPDTPISNSTYLKGGFSGRGYVTSTLGSGTLTGNGTSFLTDFAVGNVIGWQYTTGTITNIASNTSMTVTPVSNQSSAVGAYYKLTNGADFAISVPGIAPGDYVQYMEQTVGKTGNYSVVSADIGVDEVTYTLDEYYDGTDLSIMHWFVKDPSESPGLPVVSSRTPITVTWEGPSLGAGTLLSFANGTTSLTGNGTSWLSDLSVGDNLIVYPGGSNAGRTLPWVSRVASVLTNTACSVNSENESPIGGTSATSYAVANEVGSVSVSTSSRTITGTSTSFLTDFEVGDCILFGGVVAGDGVSNFGIVQTISSNTSMTIDRFPTVTNTVSAYAKAWISRTFSTPGVSSIDKAMPTPITQGSGFRYINNAFCENGETTIYVSQPHATSDLSINLWDFRPLPGNN